MAESHREEIAKLEALYASNPGGRVFVHLAEAYRKAGELERARSILSEGLGRHADSASGFVVLGRVLSDLGEEQDAADAFRRVLGLDAGNLIALRGLGDTARSGGRLREAAEHYRELLSRNPSNDEVRSLLAEVEQEAAAAQRPAAAPADAAAVAETAAAMPDIAADEPVGEAVEPAGEAVEPPAAHPDSEAPAWAPLQPEPVDAPISPPSAAPGFAGDVEPASTAFEVGDVGELGVAGEADNLGGVDDAGDAAAALPGDLAAFAGLAPEMEAGAEPAPVDDDAAAVSLSAEDREIDLQALLIAADEGAIEVPPGPEPAAEPMDLETFQAGLEHADLSAMELRAERQLSESAGSSAAEFDGALDAGSEPLPVAGYEDAVSPESGTSAERDGEAGPAGADYADVGTVRDDSADAGALAGDVATFTAEDRAYGDEARESDVAYSTDAAFGEPDADADEDAVADESADADALPDLPGDLALVDQASDATDAWSAAGTESPPEAATDWADEFPELTLATDAGDESGGTDTDAFALEAELDAPAGIDADGFDGHDPPGLMSGGDDDEPDATPDDVPGSPFSLWLGEDADAGSVDELAAELPEGSQADGADRVARAGWPGSDVPQDEEAEAPFEFDLDTVELGEAVQWDAVAADPWPDEAATAEADVEPAEAVEPEPVVEGAGWGDGEPAAAQPEPAAARQAAAGTDTGDRVPGSEWAERGLETETMADLYMSQGFSDRAADVYRALLRRRPGDERLQAKLAQAETPSLPAPEAGVRDEESGDVWLKGVGAPWTSGEAGGAEASSYVWAEPALAASEPEDEGEPIGDYLRSLTDWRPDQHEASAASADAEAVGDAAAGGGADAVEPAGGEAGGAGEAAREVDPWSAPARGVEGDHDVDPWSEPARGVGEGAGEPWADSGAAGEPWGAGDVSDVSAAEADARSGGADDTGESAMLELTETAGDHAAPEPQSTGEGGRDTAGAAFDEWYGGADTSPEPPSEAEEDDEDLAMFRSWLQSLKK